MSLDTQFFVYKVSRVAIPIFLLPTVGLCVTIDGALIRGEMLSSKPEYVSSDLIDAQPIVPR